MKTIFFDVDTQLDFVFPAGALYVPGAENIVDNLGKLTRFAASHSYQIISTADAHTEDDPEFRFWPKHCVAGATGQHKSEATLLANRVVIPNRAGEIAIAGAGQIVVEKQTIDVFQTHTFARIVQHLNPDRMVVYGVVTEICVLHAVRGLSRFGKPVTVVTDAIRSLSAQASHDALDQMRAAGAVLANAAQVAP